MKLVGFCIPSSQSKDADQAKLIDEPFLNKRLHQILIGACIERTEHLVGFGFRRNHKDGHPRIARVLSNCPNELKPVHFGHVPINEHDIWSWFYL